MERSFTAHWLGRQSYAPVHALQKQLLADRVAKRVGDTLLLVEHAPVLTLGRGADRANVLLSEHEQALFGVEVEETGRGGDVTYHGPGQLVAYPVFDLRPERCDVRRYVRDLVAVMSLLAADFGIGAGEHAKLIGAWVDLEAPRDPWPGAERARRPAKLGAVGVKLSHWCTMHGFALNATTELAHFEWIVPCGIKEHPVTSLEALGARCPPLSALASRAVEHFETVFGARCAHREGFSASTEPDARAPASGMLLG